MPQLTIGKATFDLRSARSDAALRVLRHDYPELLGLTARHVWYWDCALAPDGNPPRPEFHVIAPVLAFDRPDANGAADPPGAVARARAMMKLAGLQTPAELEAALLAAFPPVTVRIPWEAFSSYITAEASVQVVAWNRFLPFLLTLVQQPGRPLAIFGLPAGALFDAIRVNRCVPLPPDTIEIQSFSVPELPQPIKDADLRRFDAECGREDKGGLEQLTPVNKGPPGTDPDELADEDLRMRRLRDRLRSGG